MQTLKNAFVIYSPQELIKESSYWEKDNLFYINAPETTHSFGVPLWAAAYEECRRGKKETLYKERENFSFILDVGNYPGFVLSGLALGIKFFLFQGEENVFKSLQTIVHKKKGDIWH